MVIKFILVIIYIFILHSSLFIYFFFFFLGKLLSGDQGTVVENFHNAGILKYRIENNLIKTTNGLYRIIDGIIGGSPNELYRACLETNGIPTKWKNIIKQITEENENVVNLNKSMTRNGKQYNKYMNVVSPIYRPIPRYN